MTAPPHGWPCSPAVSICQLGSCQTQLPGCWLTALVTARRYANHTPGRGIAAPGHVRRARTHHSHHPPINTQYAVTVETCPQYRRGAQPALCNVRLHFCSHSISTPAIYKRFISCVQSCHGQFEPGRVRARCLQQVRARGHCHPACMDSVVWRNQVIPGLAAHSLPSLACWWWLRVWRTNLAVCARAGCQQCAGLLPHPSS